MMKFLLLAASLYALMCLLFYLLQHLILFQNAHLPKNFQFTAERPIEELWFGGEGQYHAILVKSPNPRGVIVYFHGNRGNLSRWLGMTANLRHYQYDLLLVEFPGFGKSTANITNGNFFESAELAMQYALENYGPSGIVLFGRSMGSGVASWLGAKYAISHIILETPYDTLINLIGKYAFFLPYKYLCRYNFEPSVYLENALAPVTILHGTSDNLIPVDMARRLSTAKPSTTTYVEITGGEHDNLSGFDAYWKALDAVLK